MLLALTLGCADYALREEEAMGVADSAPELEPGRVALRLDAWPAQTAPDGSPLVPQSFLSEVEGEEELQLALREPVWVEGLLTGFTPAPAGVIAIPGRQGPLAGRAEFTLPGTPMGQTVLTDADGFYSAEIVAGEGWQVAFVPDDPSVPMRVLTEQSFEADTVLDQDLELGAPVFGLVTSEGRPQAGVQVRLVDPESGVQGPLALTGEDGRFTLYAYPGAWTLVSEGPDAAIPVQQREIVVEDEAGVQVSWDVGSRSTIAVLGTILAPGGGPSSATVHILRDETVDGVRSVLDYSAGCDRNGNFLARVVPGVYDVEIVAPWVSSGGSIRLEDVEISGSSVDLGAIELPWRARVEHTLVGPDGLPVVGAQVRVQELGFEEYVFETTTSATGWFALDVTDTDLRWTITPPASSTAAITLIEAAPGQLPEQIELAAGQLVTGSLTWEGEGLPYTALDLWTQDGTFLTALLTDESGAFALRIQPD